MGFLLVDLWGFFISWFMGFFYQLIYGIFFYKLIYGIFFSDFRSGTKMVLEIKFYFSSFQQISVEGFVNQLIKKSDLSTKIAWTDLCILIPFKFLLITDTSTACLLIYDFIEYNKTNNVCKAKTKITLCISSVWLVPLLYPQCVAKDPSFFPCRKRVIKRFSRLT